MPVALNTSDALFGAVNYLFCVDNDNTIKELKNSTALTVHADVVLPSSGTPSTSAPFGRSFRTLRGSTATPSDEYNFRGVSFAPIATPTDGPESVLVVLNQLNAAAVGGAQGPFLTLNVGGNQSGMGLRLNATGNVIPQGRGNEFTGTATAASVSTGARTILITRNGDVANSVFVYVDGVLDANFTAGLSNAGGAFGYGSSIGSIQAIGGAAGFGFCSMDIVYLAGFSTALTSGDASRLHASLTGSGAFALVTGVETPDFLAPTLTSPTGTQTGSTTASGTVTTNENTGTLYRLASTNATETAATVKAATLTQAVSATGSQAVTFTGLSAGTTYYAHYVHTDAAGNDSARVSSASFTTTAAAATATTLTGPSGGTVGAASAAFTVGANGAITGTVTVTLSDGGGGGTFSPTSVAISSGTPTATFTYTASSAGAKTISISDTGSLTDAASITYTATLTAGTLTSSPLKNNTGTLLTSAGCEAYVSNPTTGALVVKKTGLTTNGSTGVASFSDGAVVAATSYRVVWKTTGDGAEGLETLTAT